MHADDQGIPGPDLWEKADRRARTASTAVQAAGGLTKLAGKRPPAAVRDHLDKCLICDQLIAEGFWNRNLVYLSKKTRFSKSRKLVPVHEKCVERGAAIAREQGYALEVGVSP